MSGAAWLTLAATLLVAVVGLIGGVYTARAPGRATPYSTVIDRVVQLELQREADVARIEKLQHEVGALKQERTDVQTEIAGLQRRIVGIIDDRDEMARWLSIFRAWIAAGAKPPAPSLPEHLADVLPKWIPTDGAELPPRLRDSEVGP